MSPAGHSENKRSALFLLPCLYCIVSTVLLLSFRARSFWTDWPKHLGKSAGEDG